MNEVTGKRGGEDWWGRGKEEGKGGRESAVWSVARVTKSRYNMHCNSCPAEARDVTAEKAVCPSENRLNLSLPNKCKMG